MLFYTLTRKMRPKWLKKIQSLHFVKKVQLSLRPQLKTTFDDELGVHYKLTDEDREKYKTGRKIG